MKLIGNILWFIFGGLLSSLVWTFFGILWSITIIGLPIGLQCFKMAKLHLWPFGKRVEYSTDTGSLLLNILWLFFGGIEIAMVEFAAGILLCLTIVGIPFGIQQFKLAVLALMPFGAQIRASNDYMVAIERR